MTFGSGDTDPSQSFGRAALIRSVPSVPINLFLFLLRFLGDRR